MYRLDNLDKKILKELIGNARLSIRKLSRRLNTSIATIASRIKKLESSGIINGYSAVLNPEKLGLDLTAVIEIVVSQGKLMEVEKTIAKRKNVIAVYDVTGETDAIIIARFRRRSELNDFIKSILSMKYVERTNTHVVLNTVKEDFRVMP